MDSSNPKPDKASGRPRRIPVAEGTTSRSWERLRRVPPLATGGPLPGFVPDFEFSESDEGLTIKADLPGVMGKNLQITNWGTQITIAGTREPDRTVPQDVYYAREISYGTFTRTFSLPSWAADYVDLEVELLHGVLTLTLRHGDSTSPDASDAPGVDTPEV